MGEGPTRRAGSVVVISGPESFGTWEAPHEARGIVDQDRQVLGTDPVRPVLISQRDERGFLRITTTRETGGLIGHWDSPGFGRRGATAWAWAVADR